jgi:hypothetical protein
LKRAELLAGREASALDAGRSAGEGVLHASSLIWVGAKAHSPRERWQCVLRRIYPEIADRLFPLRRAEPERQRWHPKRIQNQIGPGGLPREARRLPFGGCLPSECPLRRREAYESNPGPLVFFVAKLRFRSRSSARPRAHRQLAAFWTAAETARLTSTLSMR